MNEWSKEDLEEMCGDDIIEQLAFLSGCHQHQLCNSNPSGWIITDESLRKFAEFIVRECIDCLKPLSRNHSMVGAAQDTIREHFGVEE